MANKESSGSVNRRRTIFLIFLFALPACGVLFLSWKDIYSAIPTFAELQEARANGFRTDIGREVYSPHQYSIEFYDSESRRYQVRGVSKPALGEITSALAASTPVVIRYGRWRSAFPSATIFTVYQVEIGNRVIIPYSDLADAKHREQTAGPLIILCTILVAGIAIFIALWRASRFQRQLALMKARTPK